MTVNRTCPEPLTLQAFKFSTLAPQAAQNSGASYLIEQPSAGEPPIALDGAQRDVLEVDLQGLSSFFGREPAKKAKFNYLRLPRIFGSETAEGHIDQRISELPPSSRSQPESGRTFPLPRLAALRLRAWSTRMLRIMRAEMPKN